MPNGYIGQIHIDQTDYKIGSTLFAILDTDANIGSINTDNEITTFNVPLEGFVLTDGVTIHIQFKQTWTNSVNSIILMLKIGNTTAAIIENPNGAVIWYANSVISFTYDGEKYIMNTVGFDANDITIDVSQLSNLTFGNIQSTGTLQANDVTIAEGDKLIITDASDSNKIARSSLAFSAPITTQDQNTMFLRADGAWATPSYTSFNNNHRSIKINGTEILSSNSTTPLDLISGNGISITNDEGTVTITNTMNSINWNNITNIPTTLVTSVNGKSGPSITLTAGDLGLSAALRFVGTTITDMSDGWTGIPEGISNYIAPQIGDVVINGNEEYVCVKIEDTTYTWELLGRDSSFALDNAVIHNNLLTTTGDIIYRSSTAPTRLGIGTAGQVLTVSDGIPVWADNQATDNKVAQVLDTSSNKYALLFSDNQTSTTTTTIITGAKRNNSIYVTPSAGSITATKFIGALEGTLRASDVKSALETGTESGLVFLHKSGDWKTLQITNTTTTIASVSNGILTLTTSVKENATLGIAT